MNCFEYIAQIAFLQPPTPPVSLLYFFLFQEESRHPSMMFLIYSIHLKLFALSLNWLSLYLFSFELAANVITFQ